MARTRAQRGKQEPAESTEPTETEAETKAETKAAKEEAAKKSAARAEQNAATMKIVIDRCVKGDESVGDVARDLKITAGKAAFLIMQHRVATGDVPELKATDDETATKNILAARAKADEFASWGWIAARTGLPESKVKLLAEKGGYKVKGDKVASTRAAAKPKPEKAEKKAATAPAGNA